MRYRWAGPTGKEELTGKRRRTISLPMFSLFALPLAAAIGLQQADSLTGREVAALRVTTAPVIDGDLSDPIWADVPVLTGFSESDTGRRDVDQTEVRLAYDDQAIYVSVYARESQPDRIVAVQTRRGALSGDDRFTFAIDPFFTQRFEDYNEFFVNPIGNQAADFAGGRANKQEWEGVWQSAGKIVADGWTVEMRIPWSLLNRPDGSDPRTMGINFFRTQRHTQISSAWSYLGNPSRPENSGRWTGLTLPPPEKIDPLDMIGYVYTGWEKDELARRAGLDARYRFDTQRTGVLSVSPDFSNVESSVTSIDFSYSEVLGSENRPFFLEGSSFYSLSNSPVVRPLASVRIPGFDVGAKYFGRLGPQTSVGVLNTQDLGERQDSAFFARHNFSPFLSMSAAYVGRQNRGTDNNLGAVTGGWRSGNFSGSLAAMQTWDRVGKGEHQAATLGWSSGSLSLSFGHYHTSRLFLPRNGFVNFRNQRGSYLFGFYDREWRSGPVREVSVFVDADYFTRTNGSPFRKGIDSSLSARFANDLGFSVGTNMGTFEGNQDRTVGFSLNYPSSNAFRNGFVSFRSGHLGGFRYRSLSTGVNYRWLNRISLGASSEIVRIGDRFEQHIVSASYDLARDTSVGGRAVIRDRDVNWYLSFRKSGYGGTEYFLILGDPNADRFEDRVVLKVVTRL